MQPRRTPSAGRTGRAEPPPARPPHFPRFVISRAPFGAEALDHWVWILSFDPDFAVLQEPVSAWPKTLPGPAELPRNTAGVVCVWGSRGCRATCTSPIASAVAGGNPGRRQIRRAKKNSPPGFVCPGRAPGTRIAEGSGAGVTATPPPRLGGRGPRVGTQPPRSLPTRQSRRADFWSRPDLGAPQCGPEGGIPYGRSRSCRRHREAGAPHGGRPGAWPARPQRSPLLPGLLA